MFEDYERYHFLRGVKATLTAGGLAYWAWWTYKQGFTDTEGNFLPPAWMQKRLARAARKRLTR